MDIIATANLFISGCRLIIDGYTTIASSQSSKVDRKDFIEIGSQLIQAHGIICQLQSELLDAKGKLAELTSKKKLLSRYRLVKVGAGVAYRSKPASKTSDVGSQPGHFICQVCADIKGERVVLWGDVGKALYCPVCDKSFAA